MQVRSSGKGIETSDGFAGPSQWQGVAAPASSHKRPAAGFDQRSSEPLLNLDDFEQYFKKAARISVEGAVRGLSFLGEKIGDAVEATMPDSLLPDVSDGRAAVPGRQGEGPGRAGAQLFQGDKARSCGVCYVELDMGKTSSASGGNCREDEQWSQQNSSSSSRNGPGRGPGVERGSYVVSMNKLSTPGRKLVVEDTSAGLLGRGGPL